MRPLLRILVTPGIIIVFSLLLLPPTVHIIFRIIIPVLCFVVLRAIAGVFITVCLLVRPPVRGISGFILVLASVLLRKLVSVPLYTLEIPSNNSQVARAPSISFQICSMQVWPLWASLLLLHPSCINHRYVLFMLYTHVIVNIHSHHKPLAGRL